MLGLKLYSEKRKEKGGAIGDQVVIRDLLDSYSNQEADTSIAFDAIT